MHDTAFKTGKVFFETYAKPDAVVVEFGSRNVNGSLRDACPKGVTYVGLDVAPGPGVDVVMNSDSSVPLRSAIADMVVSSSMFEHDGFFWETFLEMARVT